MASLQENVVKVAEFYAEMAAEFDEVTAEPYQQWNEHLIQTYIEALRGRTILEVACGTGYWTGILAPYAKRIVATDINIALLEIAARKVSSFPNASVQVASAYTLENVGEGFSAAFAHCWLSHVPKKMLKGFFNTLHSRLQPGALVLLTDSVEEAGTGKRRVDEHGDIYEERHLRDGRRFETIKNFPTAAELKAILEDVADDIQITRSPPFWWTLSYRLR